MQARACKHMCCACVVCTESGQNVRGMHRLLASPTVVLVCTAGIHNTVGMGVCLLGAVCAYTRAFSVWEPAGACALHGEGRRVGRIPCRLDGIHHTAATMWASGTGCGRCGVLTCGHARLSMAPGRAVCRPAQVRGAGPGEARARLPHLGLHAQGRVHDDVQDGAVPHAAQGEQTRIARSHRLRLRMPGRSRPWPD